MLALCNSKLYLKHKETDDNYMLWSPINFPNNILSPFTLEKRKITLGKAPKVYSASGKHTVT